MHTQGAFSADVVHAKKVVHALAIRQGSQKVRGHAGICPENVPVIGVVVWDNSIPLDWNTCFTCALLLLV